MGTPLQAMGGSIMISFGFAPPCKAFTGSATCVNFLNLFFTDHRDTLLQP